MRSRPEDWDRFLKLVILEPRLRDLYYRARTAHDAEGDEEERARTFRKEFKQELSGLVGNFAAFEASDELKTSESYDTVYHTVYDASVNGLKREL